MLSVEGPLRPTSAEVPLALPAGGTSIFGLRRSCLTPWWWWCMPRPKLTQPLRIAHRHSTLAIPRRDALTAARWVIARHRDHHERGILRTEPTP